MPKHTNLYVLTIVQVLPVDPSLQQLRQLLNVITTPPPPPLGGGNFTTLLKIQGVVTEVCAQWCLGSKELQHQRATHLLPPPQRLHHPHRHLHPSPNTACSPPSPCHRRGA